VSVRVLIVDDTEFMRDGMRMALEPAPGIEVAGEAADGAAGVAAAERLRPDVVLMDVRMPVLDGIEATRAIVALDEPPVRVLMLTTFDLDEYLLEALAAGVSGFTLKDTPPDELVAGIEAVARDDALVDADNMVRLIARHARSRPGGRTPRSASVATRWRPCSRGSACATASTRSSPRTRRAWPASTGARKYVRSPEPCVLAGAGTRSPGRWCPTR
jgi:DNA-binding NarL/FixJ family response regulator